MGIWRILEVELLGMRDCYVMRGIVIVKVGYISIVLCSHIGLHISKQVLSMSFCGGGGEGSVSHTFF